MPPPSASLLQTQLRGRVIGPEDPDYDAACKVYNGMIDRRPKAIAQVADAADVIASVRFAREQQWPLAIRSGGHNACGLGVCDDGLVIDLRRMRSVRVDPDTRTVRADAGCQWGDVDHATHAFGLAVPSGIISTTGVGGLTLGGGLGYLSRKYGLTIDNLLEADIVLADGRLVHARTDENPDLFWALRGGGGNFGVVTSFLFRGNPVDTVIGGPTFWPLEESAGVLRRFADYIESAPEDVGGFYAFLEVPPAPVFPQELHGRIVCAVVWCYLGKEETAGRVLRPVRGFGHPLFDHVGPVPFPALQSLFDPLLPTGLQWYWKADFIRKIPEEAVRLHVQHGSDLPTALSTTHFYPINGSVHRVKTEDTAWAFRDVTFAQVIAGIDPDPANRERITSWARDYWEAVHPYSAGAAYVNFMMEEGQERVRASYGPNYDRLASIKSRYDPENLFRVNQNIQPRTQTAGG
jgi:FAD binding domain/Berberine and berberine like